MTKDFSKFLRRLLDLREGAEDKKVMIENIKDDSDFSSARLWTLVFAIGAASVGLNINSIPIVIGAMLISPLMGPIVSMGMALAINDGGLMRRSLRNLGMLTFISIVISTIYFALSPITNAQSELLSRIQPTIFDVLVAIFGGMAGFIGISRARHNNIIPGVAIATALMPPLCTIGYGLATFQAKFVFGALYLFLINSIFICLSALLVAKYLKLPKVQYPDQEHQLKVRRIITAVILVIITPAIYFAYTFVGQNNFNQNAERFINTTFKEQGYIVVYTNLSYKTSPKVIELAFLSDRFNPDQIEEFQKLLIDFKLTDTVLRVRQNNFSLSEAEWQKVLEGVAGDDAKIAALEARLEKSHLIENPAQILAEARVIEERIKDLAIGSLVSSQLEQDFDSNKPVVLIYTNTQAEALNNEAAQKVIDWLKVRLKDEDIATHFVPPIQEPEPAAQQTIDGRPVI